MQTDINFLQTFFNSKEFTILNKKLEKLIKQFTFLFESQMKSIPTDLVFKNIKQSKVMIINQYEKPNCQQFFIIVFKNVIQVVSKSDFISTIKMLFDTNPNINYCFISDTVNINDIYSGINKNNKIEYTNIFQNEINSLNEPFRLLNAPNITIRNIWKIIYQCIAGFLIKQSYLEKADTDRIENFFKNKEQPHFDENISEDDYLFVRRIGNGASFLVDLIYLIKNEELAVIKIPLNEDREHDDLIEREYKNYTKLRHPFLPKLIGKTNKKYIVSEFIYGETLDHIEKKNLKYEEKIKIISQMRTIIEFIHCNYFIYRDLKPNNIMLDNNKNVVLIDLDRMIHYDSNFENEFHTNTFGSPYRSPELNTGNFSFECDIFSFGQMIYYLITEKSPIGFNACKISDFGNHSKFYEIYFLCTKNNPIERPSILFLNLLLKSRFSSHSNLFENDDMNNLSIDSLIHNIESTETNPYILNTIGNVLLNNLDANAINYFLLAAQQNYSEASFFLGSIYINLDIKKSIHYFTLSAELNNSFSQHMLGITYLKGDINIEKSIYYLLLSVEQYNVEAQYFLGEFYYEGKYIERDIKKAIHYFQLSANQEESKAQIYLGLIYYEGKYITRDIYKSIYYFQLSADQNNSKAQYILGMIYYEEKFITRDIDKSIHYFQLSADQNDSDAQYILGLIYYEGKYVSQNIDKAIYYFQLSADQNNSNAQYYLGVIYFEGKFIARDIDKSIHYFQLSADQNNSNAQYYLGVIYFEGKYISRDIDKSLYYLAYSSQQNNANAKSYLSKNYFQDGNVENNFKKSIYLISVLAKHNHPHAQFIIGMAHLNGQLAEYDVKKSLHYLTLSANQNNSDAQYTLGIIYLEGKVVPYDIHKTIHYLSLSANQNNSSAQLYLGLIFYYGQHVQRDINKSIHYLTLSADSNNPDAQCLLGMIYYEGKDISQNINKSIRYLTLSSNQNNSTAQLYLGVIYYKGLNIQKDIDKAIYYLTLSANQNNTEAQFNLGHLYLLLKNDIKNCIYYLTLSANQNYSRAQEMLGFMYGLREFISSFKHCFSDNPYLMFLVFKSLPFSSISNKNNSFNNYKKIMNDTYLLIEKIPQDINKAIFYLSRPCNQTNPFACLLLSLIYCTSNKIPHDMGKSIDCLLKCNNNFSLIQFVYGILFLNDESNIYDINKSIEFLTKAADKNIGYAQFILGSILFEGEKMKQDINKSIYYFTKAANNNITEAQYELGNIYYNGKYVQKDIKKSIMYYQIAAEYENEKAQFTLGFFYLKGKHVNQDIDKGLAMLLNSSLNGEKKVNFILGCIYHKGKYVKRDIEESIHFYKEGSSFNDPYAKNNLAIIYKNGFENEISKNIAYAIELLKEAIKQNKEALSKYNLANIYLFDEYFNEDIDVSIELLINSYIQGFKKSLVLLCIALLKKHQLVFKNVINEVENDNKHKYKKISNDIIQFIIKNNLHNRLIFDNIYQSYKNIDFLYNYSYKIYQTDLFLKQKTKTKQNIISKQKIIDTNFYDGFGIDLM